MSFFQMLKLPQFSVSLRFQPMNFCEKTNKSKVKVQYKDFDATYKVDTPKCSAKELDAIKRELQALDSKEIRF